MINDEGAGMGEHDDRPLNQREKIAVAVLCTIMFLGGLAGGDHLIFF